MVAIPRSEGVQVGKTTETGLRVPSIAQSQVIPNAISQFGQTVSNVGFQVMQREALEQKKEEDTYRTSQALNARNKLRSFDNKMSIALKESPDDEETINTFKEKALDDRQVLLSELEDSFEGDKQLQRILKEEYETSKVAFEYSVDQQLIKKKKNYNLNNFYSSINDIKERFDTADNEVEFAQLKNDLDTTLKINLATNTITPKEIDRQQEAFRKIRKERQEQLLLQDSTRQVLNGSLVVDTSDKRQTKALDDVYNNAIIKGDIDDPITFGEQFATSTGFMPKQFKSFVTGQVLGGSTQQRVQASLSVVSMLESDKKAVLQNQIPSNVQALAYEINKRNEAGLSPTDSVEFATKEIEKNKSQERQLRVAKFEEEFGSDGSKSDYQEAIQDIADELQDESGIFFEADVPDKMAIQVRTLARDLYLSEGMNLDSAMEAAKKKVVAEWSITDVGEKRYQRFAPERFYTEMSSRDIQNQAIQEVRKATLEELPNIKKEINLLVVPQSIATGKPTYMVQRKMDNGVIEPVLGSNNLPILFRPDITKTERYKQSQEARDPLTKENFEKRRKSKREAVSFKNKFGTTDMRTLSLIGVPPK